MISIDSVILFNSCSGAGRAAVIKWARATVAVVAMAGAFSCGGSPTQPTPQQPPPVEPPVIVCPAPQTVTAPMNVPIVVTYGAPVTTGGKPPVAASCSPESGAVFPVGVTLVTCTATDVDQRNASCSVNMTVVPPPQISVTRFIAFGDSITAGEDGTAMTTLSRGSWTPLSTYWPAVILLGREYPTVLQNEMRNRYTLQSTSISVRNAGTPAERAGDPATLTRFSREVMGGGYQAVLLMEGANDLLDEYHGVAQASRRAVENLRTMARQARGAGIRPYMATLPPASRESPCGPPCRGVAFELVPGYNEQIRAMASLESIPLVDVYAAFGGDRSLLSADGLHPNAAGYERVAQAFFESIKATLEVANPQSGAPVISKSRVSRSR